MSRGKKSRHPAPRGPAPSPLERSPTPKPSRRALIVGVAAMAAIALVLVVALMQRSSNAGNGDPVDLGAAQEAATNLTPFRLTSLDGERVSLPTGRPGMVMFSGTSCTTDIPSAQDMAEFTKRAKGKVDAAYVSVDPSETPGTLADRREAIGEAPYEFAIDTSGDLAAQNQITTLGTVIVYDAAGKIVAKSVEPRMKDLEDAFKRAGVA
jgi:cytochrome oxidase Cu insertion factor (SCO1/SenC/PrrC family)